MFEEVLELAKFVVNLTKNDETVVYTGNFDTEKEAEEDYFRLVHEYRHIPYEDNHIVIKLINSEEGIDLKVYDNEDR